jgi:hypothetical protein
VTARTFADQLPAAGALAQITAAMGHLPPADFGLSPITPDRLDISIHDNLSGFERWRTALGFPTSAVDYVPRRGHMTVRATGQFAGATVELVGYAPPLPQVGGEQA